MNNIDMNNFSSKDIRMKQIFIILIFCFNLSSCINPDDIKNGSYLRISEGRNILKNKKQEVVRVKIPIQIYENEVFDGKNKLYLWEGYGKCDQTEGQSPMFVMYSNSTLKNVYISNSPEGVHIAGNNVKIDNIVNLGVCEDAVSTDIFNNHHNIQIVNSTFVNCADKAIQLNKGIDVLIKNNKFISCHIPIRVTVVHNVKVENNYATGCKHFVNNGPRVKNLEFKDNHAACSNITYSREDNSVSDLVYEVINENK